MCGYWATLDILSSSPEPFIFIFYHDDDDDDDDFVCYDDDDDDHCDDMYDAFDDHTFIFSISFHIHIISE